MANGVGSVDAVRDGIVRLLDNKLRPCGIAYVSYNALPAREAALGLQLIAARSWACALAGFEADRQVAGRMGDCQRLWGDANAPHLRL